MTWTMPSIRNKYGDAFRYTYTKSSVSSRETKQRKTKLTYHISWAILDPIIKNTR
jgi:hypothetical protein